MEETRVLTIVFTDIKGFTERTSHSDRESVSRLLAKHEELLLPLVSKYDGILIKTIGDAFLLSFASPTNAVLCAVMMQEKLKEFNATVVETEKIEIRIAMNTGEVIMRDGDVYGEPVNIAARIESLTEANEIWFSESTYLAMNRQEVPTSLLGEYRLKGIPEAVRVYRVVRDENSESYAKTVQSQLEKCNRIVAEVIRPAVSNRRRTRVLYFLGFCILLALAFVVSKESEHDMHLRLARTAIAGKDFRGAVESLKKAVQLQPADPETSKMIELAIDSHIYQGLKISTKDEAALTALVQFVQEARTAFSILDNKVLASEVDLIIEQAGQQAQNGNRNQADEMLDQLARQAGQDTSTLFKIAGFYSKSGYNWTRTINYMLEAGKSAPDTLASDPQLLAEFTWFLQKVAPADGYDEVRTFILDHCYPQLGKLLQDSLYAPGPENHTLRWNARKMLPGKGIEIADTRFFLTDLLTSPGDLNSSDLNETLSYFILNATNPAVLAEIAVEAASLPQILPIFENYQFEKEDPAIQVAAGVLYTHLQDYLHSRLSSEQTQQRINAYLSLTRHGEIEATNLWNYHLRNLIDYKTMQWSRSYVPALLDSIDFLCKNTSSEKILADNSLAATVKQAAKAIKELINQLEIAVTDNQENSYEIPEKRSIKDLTDLATRLHQALGQK